MIFLKCNRCGSLVNDGSKFCPFCGSALDFNINNNNTSNGNNNTSNSNNNYAGDGFTNVFASTNNTGNVNHVNNNSNQGMNLGINNQVTNTNNFNYNNIGRNGNQNLVNNKTNNRKSGFNTKVIVGTLAGAFVLLFFIFGGFSLFSNKRTIMIYMIGSNLESEHASASTDIKEMLSSNVNLKDVNILIYTGGSKKWFNNSIPSDKNVIFKLTDTGLEKLVEYDKTSMTNPDTLANFLNYGYKNFKASKYSLILWDHGGGPIYGYGQDENYVGSLTLSKLKQAFENSPFKNKKLEMVGFDACLMSSIEVANTVSKYANYMVASQEVEPGYGWDYKFLGEVDKRANTKDLGISIINYYNNYYKNMVGCKGITLSLLDLSKIKDVENKLDDLFGDVDQNLTIDFSSVSRTRNSAKSFGKVSATSIYDLVDLEDLINKLPSKYASKVTSLSEAIDSFVVFQTTDLDNTYGVSIYFPYENKENVGTLIYQYKEFDFAKEYTDFITNFSSKLTGTRVSSWNLENNTPTVDSSNTISVEVPSDVAENYSSASYVIFEKIDDKYYMPRFKGSDVKVSGNTFTTTIEKKGLVAYDSADTVYLTVFESEKGKDYIKYLIPATLQKWGSKMSENFEMEAVYIEFVVDNLHPEGIISGAIPILGDNETVAPKITYDLKDWKLVQLWNSSYKIFDDFGNYTTNWESSGTLTGVEFKIEDDFKLEFRNLDSTKEYYALFHITDSQGNRYTTNIVKVNI